MASELGPSLTELKLVGMEVRGEGPPLPAILAGLPELRRLCLTATGICAGLGGDDFAAVLNASMVAVEVSEVDPFAAPRLADEPSVASLLASVLPNLAMISVAEISPDDAEVRSMSWCGFLIVVS